jgi:hypothetical protein
LYEIGGVKKMLIEQRRNRGARKETRLLEGNLEGMTIGITTRGGPTGPVVDQEKSIRTGDRGCNHVHAHARVQAEVRRVYLHHLCDQENILKTKPPLLLLLKSNEKRKKRYVSLLHIRTVFNLAHFYAFVLCH